MRNRTAYRTKKHALHIPHACSQVFKALLLLAGWLHKINCLPHMAHVKMIFRHHTWHTHISRNPPIERIRVVFVFGAVCFVGNAPTQAAMEMKKTASTLHFPPSWTPKLKRKKKQIPTQNATMQWIKLAVQFLCLHCSLSFPLFFSIACPAKHGIRHYLIGFCVYPICLCMSMCVFSYSNFGVHKFTDDHHFLDETNVYRLCGQRNNDVVLGPLFEIGGGMHMCF